MGILGGPYDFTAANGSSLGAGWADSASSAGSSATVQGNRARLDPGSTGGYAGKHAVRWTGGTVADAQIETTLNYAVAGDQVLQLWLRTTTTTSDGNTGYFFYLERSGTLTLYEAVSFSYTSLGTTSLTFTTGSDYGAKFRCVGSSLKAKAWLLSGAEPDWQVNVTDSTITAAGYVHMHLTGGGSASQYVDVDNTVISDGQLGSLPPLTIVNRPMRIWRV